ncbi:unnamed protein product, partial [Penicillium discolor]
MTPLRTAPVGSTASAGLGPTQATEGVGADATGRAALRRVLREGRDLRAAGIGAGQDALRAGHRGDHGVGVRADGAEEEDRGARAELDARHATGRRALGADRRGREPQQLRIRRQEHEVGVILRVGHPDHGVSGLEGDDLQVGPHGQGRRHDALHDALRGAERDGGLAVETDEPEDALALGRDPQVVAKRSPRGELHRGARHRGQVHGGEADDASRAGERPDLAADRRLDRREDGIVLAPPGRSRQLLSFAEVHAHGAARRREDDGGRRVGDLQVDGALRRTGLRRGRVHQQGAPRRPVRLGHGVQLPGDGRAQQGRAGEQLAQRRDLREEGVALRLELDARELGQTSQPQLEDVLGLRLAEVEHGPEPGAGLLGVVRRPDDLDDLVDVEDRDEQTLHQVQALLPAGETVPAAAGDDLDAVADVDAEHLLEPEGAGLAVDEGDVVDAEGVLQRGEPVELLQHGVRIETGLDPDGDAEAVVAVGEIGDVADALQLLRLHRVADLLDETLRTDH